MGNKSLRYSLSPQRLHYSWKSCGKEAKMINLFAFRKYSTDNRDAITYDVVRLAELFGVPTDALAVHDSFLHLSFVLKDGQYIPLDKIKNLTTGELA